MRKDCGDMFFFKQSTAYEMRISDWSSDLCSSDLSSVRPAPAVNALNKNTQIAMALGRPMRSPNVPKSRFPNNMPKSAELTIKPACAGSIDIACMMHIGRASCRERVGQYV